MNFGFSFGTRDYARDFEFWGFFYFKGVIEPNTLLSPTDLISRPGKGIWSKRTNWQANHTGQVDPQSERRGRITEDFKVAPFFDHVKVHESGHQEQLDSI